MYEWRNMTQDQRRHVMALRRQARIPWHSPPHWNLDGERQYVISAACYEHAPIIGTSSDRMADCEQQVLEACRPHATQIHAWCILPNHYHILLRTAAIAQLRAALGQFHGRSSRCWNQVDGTQGRHVWHNCVDRPMRSEAHFYASLNYVHHNPVKHGYVELALFQRQGVARRGRTRESRGDLAVVPDTGLRQGLGPLRPIVRNGEQRPG